MNVIRYSEDNPNSAALEGKWGQLGEKNATFTLLKNILFINLRSGAEYDSLKLPTCYDGFLICSDGTSIKVTNSTLTCKLDEGVTAFGQLVLKAWN